MSKREAVLTRHTCDKCGTESTPVNPEYAKYLPQGWSHLTYVVPSMTHGKLPGALEDNKEYDFCYECSKEILDV